MRAGRLRHKVTIEKLVPLSPGVYPSGEEDQEWTTHLSNVSAEWITLRGTALHAAQQHHSEVRGVWRIRWRDSITDRMRIVHNGRYYNILWVPPYDKRGKKRELDLECAEGVNQGER